MTGLYARTALEPDTLGRSVLLLAVVERWRLRELLDGRFGRRRVTGVGPGQHAAEQVGGAVMARSPEYEQHQPMDG